MWLEAALLLVALGAALAAQPWRMLASRTPLAHESHGTPSVLWTPLLATLVLLPWLWALPSLHAMPLQLQWSGACLVVLMLGWPLAVLVLLAVGTLAGLIADMGWEQALALTVWLGLVPATLALLLGTLLRRFTGERMFVYILGRAFIGTALCGFAASVLAQALGQGLPGVAPGLSLVAHWLMAWGDAIVTGMLAAVFVAFKPEWLATWSDHLYLKTPR
ncbi:MAG: hypothetical protein HYY98_09620 [Burkholderiales bacterium]|jgi:uncharacterized membrane protein|nr:hypothetical protein [Burkholderiales bacterium]